LKIQPFVFWFIGFVVLIASLLINWKKFFLFVLVGLGFAIYGLYNQFVKKIKK